MPGSAVREQAAAAGDPSAPAAEKPSRISIRYIGMHIGGGPNDRAAKAPFERALSTAFGAIEQCCNSVECGAGTFGVDLLVPKEGGHAELTNPRTALSEVAARCIKNALGEVQFATPKLGKTKLSYSIRLDLPGPE